MNSILSKSAAVILVVLLAAGIISSCGNDAGIVQDPRQTKADNAGTEEAVPGTEARKYADSISEELDFNGQIMRILIQDVMAGSDLTGESGGDIVLDSVYKRNLTAEERFNVKIQPEIVQTMEHSVLEEKVRSSILSDSEPYHVYMGRGREAFNLSCDGYLVGTTELPYLDIGNPWWYKECSENMALNSNEIYVHAGDICLSEFMYSNVMFFNKEHFTSRFGDYNELLYNCVFDGKWTYDVFLQYVEQSYDDINGNGMADIEDYYGFVYLDFAQGWYFLSAGVKYISRDEQGYPVLDQYNDYIISLAERLSDLFSNDLYGLRCDNNYYKTLGSLFAEEKCLFLPARFNYIDWNLREMEDPFGVLPYPKISESLDYMAGSGESGNFIAVPVNNRDLEMTSAVLEALCAESSVSVFPKYYETALKIKYTDGGVDAKMIDLIHDGFMCYPPNGVVYFISDVVMNGKGHEYSSYYQKNIEKSQKNLDQIISNYEENIRK